MYIAKEIVFVDPKKLPPALPAMFSSSRGLDENLELLISSLHAEKVEFSGRVFVQEIGNDRIQIMAYQSL